MTTHESLTLLARGIAIIVAVILVAALHLAQDVIIPLVLAGLLCFVLTPLVNRLEDWRIPRIPAVLITTMLAFAAIGVLAYFIAGQLLDLAYQLPAYKDNIRNKVASLQVPSEGPLGNLARTFTELRDEFVKKGPGPAQKAAAEAVATDADAPSPSAPIAVPVEVVNSGGVGTLLQRAAAPVLGPLGTAAVVVVFVVFMLLKKEDLRNRVIHLAGRSRLSLTTFTLAEAGSRVSRYLLMQLVVNVTYAVPIAVGLLVIGVPNAILWAMLTAVLRFVPYIGPWIGAFFPITLSLAVSDSWTMPIYTVGLFVVVEIFSNNVMEPWLYGSSTGLSPVAILVAAVFWTWLWGTVGLLLSTPLTVCIAVLGKHVPGLMFLDVLLGDRPSLPAQDRYYQRLLARDETEAAKVLVECEKSSSWDVTMAEVIAPTVLAAEADLDHGQLPPEGYGFILSTIRKHAVRPPIAPEPAATSPTVSGEASAPVSAAAPALAGPPDVLIIPAEDEGDEVVGILLGEMLGAKIRTRVISHQMLTTEKAEEALASGAPVICISDTSVHGAPRARFLGRRLRQRNVTAFVFTGLWSLDDEESRVTELAEKFGADEVATNLTAARDALRGWVVQPSVIAATPAVREQSPTV